MWASLSRVTHAIDWMNERIGLAVRWLVLIAVLISSGNATVRYVFSTSSNAWLDWQWYLFAAVFLVCASYALGKNEHVRIDVITGSWSARRQAWIDVLGGLFFLLPMSIITTAPSCPVYLGSFQSGDTSASRRAARP